MIKVADTGGGGLVAQADHIEQRQAALLQVKVLSQPLIDGLQAGGAPGHQVKVVSVHTLGHQTEQCPQLPPALREIFGRVGAGRMENPLRVDVQRFPAAVGAVGEEGGEAWVLTREYLTTDKITKFFCNICYSCLQGALVIL